MKAPNALKRVGRSIGVIRTKVRNTVKRNQTGRGTKRDQEPVFDVREDIDTENRPTGGPEENGADPRDFLTMMRSGSLEDFGMMPSHLDKALIAIENEQTPEEGISLPPQVSREENANLIHSPPNVKANPMTFAEYDNVALDEMARSMSNLVSTTYSKIVDGTNAAIQDALSFKEEVATGQEQQNENVPAEVDLPTNAADAQAKQDTDAVIAESGLPIQTLIPYEDDEETVTTEGPDVVLPPTVQLHSTSITGRAPKRTANQVDVMKAAFSNFGGNLCLDQRTHPTCWRVYDAFRDVMCCPGKAVGDENTFEGKEVSRAAIDTTKESIQEAEGNADIVEQATAEDSTSDLESDGKDSDSFDEIAQATLLVSDMIKVKGSFTSVQCDQVEKALKVLEEKAKKIGVNESDLLAAMASSEDASSGNNVKNVPSSIGMSS